MWGGGRRKGVGTTNYEEVRNHGQPMTMSSNLFRNCGGQKSKTECCFIRHAVYANMKSSFHELKLKVTEYTFMKTNSSLFILPPF